MDKLKEIKAEHAAATPGPWQAEGHEIWHRGESYDSENDNHAYITDVFHEGNRNLIAHTPEYITYLLQLVETQSKALEWYAEENNYIVDKGEFGEYYPQQILIDKGEKAREALKLTNI